MSGIMTVQQAFAKATQLKTLQAEQLGILQNQAKYANSAVSTSAMNVGLEAGTWAAGGRTPKVTNTDAKGFKGDLRKLFLWGPVKAEMKRQGGWWKFAAYFWDGVDTAGDIAKGGCHPVVLAYSLGTYVSDIVIDVHKYYQEEKLKELAKDHDFVLSAFISTRHKICWSIDDVIQESQRAVQKVSQKWISKGGSGNKWYQLLMQARRDGRPEAGRRLVRSLLNQNITDDLAYLDSLAASLYSLGVAGEAFSAQCAQVGANPTNQAAGFPGYKGFVSRDRKTIISSLTTDVDSLLPDARKRVEELDTVVANLYNLFARNLQ